MERDKSDPNYVPSLDEFFEDVERNIAARKRDHKPKQEHPHAKLKREARTALSLWKKRTGISAYYLPYFVGVAYLGAGRVKRKAYIGKKGVSDSFIGLLGTVVAAEAKTGDAVLKPDQREFRRRWEKAGLPFCEYRTPQQLIDFLDLTAARQGWRPF
jgi:hypothetical protein